MCICLLSPSMPHSLTHSLTHPPTHPPTHSLNPSLARLLTHSTCGGLEKTEVADEGKDQHAKSSDRHRRSDDGRESRRSRSDKEKRHRHSRDSHRSRERSKDRDADREKRHKERKSRCGASLVPCMQMLFDSLPHASAVLLGLCSITIPYKFPLQFCCCPVVLCPASQLKPFCDHSTAADLGNYLLSGQVIPAFASSKLCYVD